MAFELNREIPENNTYDVIVAGGGPAGCAAAAAASKEGAKTLLLERTGMLGGAGTAGLVPAWAPFSDGLRVIYSGLASKVFEATKRQMYHIDPEAVNWVPIDAEALKSVYDNLLEESGVQVLFQSQVCGVEMAAPDTVSCLLVANKAGLSAYSAKVYVDCTGDADICAWAGADYWQGGEFGELQAATQCFVLSNVDEYGFHGKYNSLHPGNPDSPIYEIVKDDAFDIKDVHCCSSFVGPHTMGFNAGHVTDIDGTNPESVSHGLKDGRKIAHELKDALAKHFPRAFADAFLVETAPALGIRETRRVEGDYIFTVNDYLNRQSFPDEICRNNYYIDVHGQAGVDDKKPYASTSFERYKQGESHGIPYRCLTPKKLKNVLVAGRIISSDRLSQGSLRVMPTCLSTGEAAGTAAALAMTMAKPDVHAVDAAKIRAIMKTAGAYLPEN